MIDGFSYVPAALSVEAQTTLVADLKAIIRDAAFYTPTMPKTGKPLSVRMTNAGPLGWLTDKAGGYRYEAKHPETGRPWPPIPPALIALWQEMLGSSAPPPEACLINWYAPDAKLGMHRDADEADQITPVVSVSLGDDAWFRVGGLKRRDPSECMLLRSGDVVVLGGAARRAYHGIDRIVPGTGSMLDAPGRLNLTLRRVTVEAS